jgi:4-amino-4-deoxy-L-arabinose transferase-like glycosyltransferase
MMKSLKISEWSLSRLVMVAVLVLMAGTSILLASHTPTFDFDEALYRRLAEEMKASHQYFAITWDSRPFYEKPPTYLWTIVASSRLLDGPSPAVSLLACRLPSLLFSALTITLLSIFWHRFGHVYAAGFASGGHVGQRIGLSAMLPPIAFGTALLPMAGVASVLLDPMLTFFLTIILLILAAALLRRKTTEVRLSACETAIAASAMAGAMAVKGLIGIVLPAIAVVTHEMLTTLYDAEARPRLRCFWRRLVGVASGVAASFGLAAILAGGIYAFFYRAMGPAFLNKFLVGQQFGRAARPLQGHHGTIFYYVVVLFAAGPAMAFAANALAAKRRSPMSFAQWGFPLSWSAALIVFFSLLATKLPHYTWPVWPALTLSLCILITRASAMTPAEDQLRHIRLGWLRISVAAIGIGAAAAVSVVTLAVSFGLDVFIERFVKSLRTRAILMSIEPLPLHVRFGLGLIAVAVAFQIVQQWMFVRKVTAGAAVVWRILAGAAALNSFVLLIGSLAVVPYFDQTIRGPFVRLSSIASKQHIAGGDLTTITLFSPTVSSSYGGGPVTQLGARQSILFVPASQHLVLAPVWQSASCRQPGFVITHTDEFLLLCTAPGRQHSMP